MECNCLKSPSSPPKIALPVDVEGIDIGAPSSYLRGMDRVVNKIPLQPIIHMVL